MRALWLDFQKAPPGQHRPGWWLLGIGALLSVLLITLDEEISDEEAQLSEDIRQLKRLASGAGDPRQALLTSRNARFDTLLNALETAHDDSVTLLDLKPGQSDIRLAGEAKDQASTLAYINRLQATPAFASLYLAESQVLDTHPQRPIRFSILARWPGQVP
jgi:Tfp pilus assembly protein PilN